MSNRIKDFRPREYRKEDYEEVAILWDLTGMGRPERGDDNKTIEKSIRLGGKFIILEEINTGRIVGTSWLTFDGRRLHLHHFGILPELQNQGLGKMLLEITLKEVKLLGIQVKLEVHRSNIKAINLYKKYGFSYLGDYLVYIIRDTSNNIIN